MDVLQQVSQNVRIRDQNRLENPRKKSKLETAEVKRESNLKWKANPRKNRGRMEYYFSEEAEKTELLNKMDTIKMMLGEGKLSNTNTFEFLTSVCDFFLEKNATKSEDVPLQQMDTKASPSYQYISMSESFSEDIFVCTTHAVSNLISRIQEHKSTCADSLQITNTEKVKVVTKLELKCDSGHTIQWYSSPHIEGGKLYANVRIAHGFLSSGMLPVQFEKFCTAASLGHLGEKYMATISRDYCSVVGELAGKSETDALEDEIALAVASDLDDGIGIMTDARHCWRRNARFSDVVCIGDMSHKVLRVETISKLADDPCSQRHELLGVRRIYDYLDNQQCPVLFHAHDNNASVIKFVREERCDTDNANDTWHMAKGVTKQMAKVTKGKKKDHGVTWHAELSDKAASVRTHIFHCAKRCNGDAQKLRRNIDNVTSHYKGNHAACDEASRCRTDPNYEPSKTMIQSETAEKLLRDHLRSLAVYKKAELYAKCKDTHYVESFNNAMLMYVDKRIVFGSDTYKMRVNLAVLDWNENVDRPITSRQQIEDARNPRRQLGSVVHKRKTFRFRDVLWGMLMEKLYGL